MRSAWWMTFAFVAAGCAATPNDGTAIDGTRVNGDIGERRIRVATAADGPVFEGVATISNGGGAQRIAAVSYHAEGRSRVLVAFRDPHPAASQTSGMAFALSDDGGANWESTPIPMSNHPAMGFGPMINEPTLAVSPRLNVNNAVDVYFAGVASVPTLSTARHRQIVIAHSTDGGRTFLEPIVAASPRVTDWFTTADHPSLAVDANGRVHLFFVADLGQPSEALRHWVGMPMSMACQYSCMTWEPASAPAPAPERDRHPLGTPIAHFMRNEVYLAFDEREPVEGSDGRLETVRINALKYDPFMHRWAPMSSQPWRGRWFTAPASARVEGGGVVAAGRHFDFGLDDNVGWFTWTSVDDSGASAAWAQSFTIRDVTEERWGFEEQLAIDHEGALFMQPTLALASTHAPSISWLAQRNGASDVTLYGAARHGMDEGGAWSAVRNVGAIGESNAADLCGAPPSWTDQIASIVVDESDTSQPLPMMLTVHASSVPTRCALVDSSSARLIATRWSASL